MKAATIKSKRNSRVTVAQFDGNGDYIFEFKRMLEPHEEEENFPPQIKTQRRMKTTTIRLSEQAVFAVFKCLETIQKHK
jgi:hypothetical protein